jgi:hypothetical protein
MANGAAIDQGGDDRKPKRAGAAGDHDMSILKLAHRRRAYRKRGAES